jgi:hypothetical protein
VPPERLLVHDLGDGREPLCAHLAAPIPNKPYPRRFPNLPVLAEILLKYHLRRVMMDAHEKRLIEALKKVDRHGDIAPAHVHDPMTMVLRQRALQAVLMRWDDNRGHYVLTGAGRSRITARSRGQGAVLSFKKRVDRSGPTVAGRKSERC